jgi:hypothetical protein
VVRTSASCTSERATGRCNNAPFWVYHGRLASGAISDERRPCARAGTQSTSPSIVKAFAVGAHKRQAARASARPGDAITRRFWFVPRPVLAPVGQSAECIARTSGICFLGGAGLFSTTKNGVLFSLASTPCKWDPQLELICSGPRGHPNMALDSAAKSLDVSQSSAYADAPRRVRASAKQGHIRWG